MPEIKEVRINFPKTFEQHRMGIAFEDLVYVAKNIVDLEKLVQIPRLEKITNKDYWLYEDFKTIRRVIEVYLENQKGITYRVMDFDTETGYYIASQEFTREKIKTL